MSKTADYIGAAAADFGLSRNDVASNQHFSDGECEVRRQDGEGRL